MVWFAAKLQMVLRWGGGERKHFVQKYQISTDSGETLRER